MYDTMIILIFLFENTSKFRGDSKRFKETVSDNLFKLLTRSCKNYVHDLKIIFSMQDKISISKQHTKMLSRSAGN